MNRIGSLCTGYGGLDLAVENALGGEMVWYSEFEKHPSALLAQRFPGIPNLGDLTKIDWASLPEVDILTGGYPCQPFSQAGKRLGEDDPRHLWPHIRQAIRVLRPRITVLENVRGHRSKGFSTVLRDCAEDGLDVRWVSVRASDAGAPHKRDRIFFVATNPTSDGRCEGRREDSGRSPRVGESPTDQPPGSGNPSYTCDGRYVPLGERGRQAASYSERFGCHRRRTAPEQESRTQQTTTGLRAVVQWGDYEPAIRHWERVLGRPAPSPTEPNKNGRPRLTAAFDEWMMGLPEGWVTDSGLPYGAQLKLLGNGVVPQQAELAIRYLTMNGG